MRTDEAGTSQTVEAESRRTETERGRILRGLRYCLAVFLGVRVGLSVLALVAVALLPHPSPIGEAAGIPPPVNVPGWVAPTISPGWHNLVTPGSSSSLPTP